MSAPAQQGTSPDVAFRNGDLELRAARWGDEGPAVMLVHGLMANAQCFGGLTAGGLADHCQVIAPDLRGRGLSDKPMRGYSIRAQAEDLIRCMDAWGKDTAVLAGHSFGGLLTLYCAARYPHRITGQVLIDTPSPRIHNPLIMAMLQPSMRRLGKTLPSMDEHLARARKLPYLNGLWDDPIEAYFRADVEQLLDGRVKVRTPRRAIRETVTAVALENWLKHTRGAKQPARMIHSVGAFGPKGFPPIILRAQSRDLSSLLADCDYKRVAGNHFSMLFGDAGRATAGHIVDFVQGH